MATISRPKLPPCCSAECVVQPAAETRRSHSRRFLRPTSALCHCARFPDSAILSEDGTIIFHHITQPFFFSGVASPIFMVFLPRGKSRQHRP